MEPTQPNSIPTPRTPIVPSSNNTNQRPVSSSPNPTSPVLPKKSGGGFTTVFFTVLVVTLIAGGGFYWWSSLTVTDIRSDIDTKYSILDNQLIALEQELDDLNNEIGTPASNSEDTQEIDTTEESNDTESSDKKTEEIVEETTNETNKTEDVALVGWNSYKNDDYGFSLSYPAEFNKLTSTNKWVYKTGLTYLPSVTGEDEANYESENKAIFSLEGKSKETNYYPTIKINAFSLDGYVFNIPPGNEYIYDADNKGWLANDGYKMTAISAQTVTVGDYQGYNLRSEDLAGNFYSVVAVPLEKQDIMLEIGFSGNGQEKNQAPGQAIFDSFTTS